MINIISLISSIGIGIGSMALIIILSVYNGFDTLVKSFYEGYQPDFIITPAKGKSFNTNTQQFSQVYSLPELNSVMPVVEETVFVVYNERQAIASIKGVLEDYGSVSGVANSIVEGEFKTRVGEVNHAIVGRQLASDLRIRVRFLSPIELYFPDRNSQISMLNPAASLNDERLYPSGLISLNNEFDKGGIYIPIHTARELLGYSQDEVTSVELYLKEGVSADIEKTLHQILGDGFVIKGRYEQNETLYKMMRAEKFAVYLILFFVIFIVSVNIFGSLSMLMLDKKGDMQTYKSMGATSKMIGDIFVLQGWLISIVGAVVGIAFGLILCFVQDCFGVIPMPGNYIVDTYPVDVHFIDVLITFAGVITIGYLIAKLPVRALKKDF